MSEASRLQVLRPDGVPCQVVEVPGVINLTGLCTDGECVYVCDIDLRGKRGSCVHVLRLCSGVEV